MDTLTAPRTTEDGARGGRAGTRTIPASVGHGFQRWPAIAAWGGGLIQLALGAAAVTGVEGDLAIRVAGILLLVIGAAAVGWGAVTLARGRIVVPRLSVAGALAGILVAVAAMALDPARVSVLAVAAESALLIAVAFAGALALRRANRPARSKTREAEGPRLVGLLVSASIVAALVTPALAATEAGQHAVPHGEHSEMVEPGHH